MDYSVPNSAHEKCLNFRENWVRYFTAYFFSAFLIASHPTAIFSMPSPSRACLEERVWVGEGDKLIELEVEAARIVQLEPHSAFGHYLLAQISLKRFRQNPSQLRFLQQASDLGQQAIELEPALDFGYLIAAQVLDLMGYTENGILALEGDPKIEMQVSWRTFLTRGILENNRKRGKDSLESFRSGLNLPGSMLGVMIPYLIATIKSGANADLILLDEMRKWRIKIPHDLFDLNLAIALTEQKNYREAHAIFQKLQDGKTSLADAYIHDAIILSDHLHHPKDAVKILKSFLNSRLEFDSSKKNLARAHLARINIGENQEIDNSKKILAEIIGSASNPSEWLIFSQKAFEKSNRLNDFVSFLTELQKTGQPSGFIFALQGEILSESLARHELAIESFRSAIILEPARSEFYNGLGLVYYRINEFQKSLASFQEATQLDPRNAASRYNEACVLAITGRTNEALGSLSTAISLDPKLSNSARQDVDFINLRGRKDFLDLVDFHSNLEPD